MPISMAAARSEWHVLTSVRSAATPGPKHFSSVNRRTESTGCNFCSIPLFYRKIRHCQQKAQRLDAAPRGVIC